MPEALGSILRIKKRRKKEISFSIFTKCLLRSCNVPHSLQPREKDRYHNEDQTRNGGKGLGGKSRGL
jgi:hypothetical protein